MKEQNPQPRLDARSLKLKTYNILKAAELESLRKKDREDRTKRQMANVLRRNARPQR
jgi:hypothetical protein